MSRAFLLAAILTAAGFHGALAGGCDRVNDAWAKKFMTPNKATDVIKMNDNAPLTTVTIELNGKSYMKTNMNLTWTESSFDSEKEAAEVRASTAKSQDVCERTGSEAVSGETADVYTVMGGLAPIMVWISKSSGLPLKSSTQVASSDGKAFSFTRLLEYGDIQPPPAAEIDSDAPPQLPVN